MRQFQQVVDRLGVLQIDSVNVLARAHLHAGVLPGGRLRPGAARPGVGRGAAPARRDVGARGVVRAAGDVPAARLAAARLPGPGVGRDRRGAAEALADRRRGPRDHRRARPDHGAAGAGGLRGRPPDHPRGVGLELVGGQARARVPVLHRGDHLGRPQRRVRAPLRPDQRVLPPTCWRAPSRPTRTRSGRWRRSARARTASARCAASPTTSASRRPRGARDRRAGRGGRAAEVVVDGWNQGRCTGTGTPAAARATGRALLNPFDPLVFERRRLEALFGLRYRIEIYSPSRSACWGYYVLPFLLGETLARAGRPQGRPPGGGAARARRAPGDGFDRARTATSSSRWRGAARARGVARARATSSSVTATGCCGVDLAPRICAGRPVGMTDETRPARLRPRRARRRALGDGRPGRCGARGRRGPPAADGRRLPAARRWGSPAAGARGGRCAARAGPDPRPSSCSSSRPPCSPASTRRAYFAAVQRAGVAVATLVALGAAPLLVAVGTAVSADGCRRRARWWRSGWRWPGSCSWSARRTPRVRATAAGALLALVAAAAFATMTGLNRRSVPGLGPLPLTATSFTLGGILLLPVAAVAGPGARGPVRRRGLGAAGLPGRRAHRGGLQRVLHGPAARSRPRPPPCSPCSSR